ncbi:Por secretion system C-terminal sorting domain-containing protein [Cyclonatronum proteinivorum]|uniref:Por secretion system C-terminal sorting domain-containing protein n=1 Tax=Cyclonatronum proteinivorum TaxID=1457365 RepID=A0A345UNS7_9BACT|nr:endonuclease/exonuclease/phosphatase family protein [Cyclonatronum proteinivorum]AXJ02129.1 Por secretion system C-terminal sorting domain-containing protein [Cyclonatronum proteinivorum]
MKKYVYSLLFLFMFSGLLVQTQAQQTPIPIAEARQLPLGTTVTVAGWVTVTDEFRGPVFFQDETGGMAWFNGPLMRTGTFDIDIAQGDSLVVTGQLREFGNIPGIPGSGLLQIENPTPQFEVFPEGNRIVEPVSITLADLATNDFQGQLVSIDNVTVDRVGALRPNASYAMIDDFGDGTMRIQSRAPVVNTPAPEPGVTVIGIAAAASGNAQLWPRRAADTGHIFPGDDLTSEETFDIVTWNIEWFGHPENGPDDVELQFENVIEVIETVGADLYTFQEIANTATWNQLVNALEDYGGYLAQYTQTQRTAFLYRLDTITPRGFGLLSTGQNPGDWAGRLPLWMRMDVTIGNETREVWAYGVHAKAFADPTSYQQRVNASQQLKTFLDANRQDDNVIFFGDYNDRLLVSTWNNQPSPYQNFVEDPNYLPVSLSLEEGQFSSFRTGSMIDHIIVTNQLADELIEGSQRVVNITDFITDYFDTTSDHSPVAARFQFQNTTSSGDIGGYTDERPASVSLLQNYPNPFNPTTNISFELPETHQVSLVVYTLTGQRVASLLSNETLSAGRHTVAFDATGLASGMYLYSLTVGDGIMLSGTMSLVR